MTITCFQLPYQSATKYRYITLLCIYTLACFFIKLAHAIKKVRTRFHLVISWMSKHDSDLNDTYIDIEIYK